LFTNNRKYRAGSAGCGGDSVGSTLVASW